ncbi:MAG: UDP-N-acetylmuramate--L-alanine ligase, partial [Clostridiales bacterium]|nr:UDP-N-acetylmuramate--L-alanine ligase [Clostridiales bacterium]
VMIGGYLPLLQAGHRVGAGNTIVMESCEYCNSFLNFFPTTAVILNIDADHLDFFKDLKDIEHSFRAFADLVPPDGLVVANGDDANTVATLQGYPGRLVWFGMAPSNLVHPGPMERGFSSFDVFFGDTRYTHLDLKVLGRHNALNALAACAVAHEMGIDGETVRRALATFGGAGRRLEFKGTFHGAMVYDDYAHHPSELHATLEAVRALGCQRVICAFQPHTYTRTHALFQDFIRELQAADLTVLAEIYAAREQNTIGISSRDLAANIDGSVFFETLPEVTEYLRRIAQPGDLILTVGAGDIYTVADALIKDEMD